MAEVQYILSLKDLLTQKLKDADKAADQLEGKMNGLQSTLNNIAAGVGVAFGIGAIKDFVSSVVTVGSEFEKTEIGLKTLLGTAEEAKQVFANIKKDAATTPFDINSLLLANKALISAGVDANTARGDVLNLANAIAATGGGNDELSRMVINLQQIKNTGKATALDIKQFAYAGVNIYGLLAAATGKTVEETKGMEVSYELLTYALNKAHQAGGIYANGLENLSKTTGVQLSNLGDEMLYLKDDIFQGIKGMVDTTIGSVNGLIVSMRSAVGWAKEHATEIKTIGVFVGTLVTGIALYNTYVFIAAKATLLWNTAQALLNGTMAINPIGAMITGIALLTAGVFYLWNTFEGFRGTVVGLYEAAITVFKNIAQGAKTYLGGVGNIVKGIFTLDFELIKEGGQQIVTGLKGVYLEAGKGAKESFAKGYKSGVGMKVDNPFKAAESSTTEGSKSSFGGASVPSMASGSGSKSSVTGVRPTNINITIGKLVEGFTVTVNDTKEGARKIEDIVTRALVSSVNDASIIAGGL